MSPKRLYLFVAISSIAVNMLLVYAYRKDIRSRLIKNKSHPYGIANNVIDHNYSTYFCYDSTGNIPFVTRRDTAQPLPEQLIIAPGIYNIDDKTVNMEREGLYRFVYTDLHAKQFIVYKHQLNSLLSAICWIHTHGENDNKLTNEQRTQKAMSGKLYLTCSRIVDYTMHLLMQAGYRARIAEGVTQQAHNGHDDSHSMIEVYDAASKKWILADMDNNRLFVKKSDSSTVLSYAEMRGALYDNDIRFIPLSADIRVNTQSAAHTESYPYEMMYERFNSHQKMTDWYKRVCEIMLINSHFYSAKDSTLVRRYRVAYQYMDSTSFMQAYYSSIK